MNENVEPTVMLMPRTWKLEFDILTYLMNELELPKADLVSFMSTCHSLRCAGVRALLNSGDCLEPFLTPARLSSFCAFMMVDFPSRCIHVRQHLNLIMPELVKFRAYSHKDLLSLSRIIAHSPNIKSLSVDLTLLSYLATVNPDFHRSFNFRPALKKLDFEIDNIQNSRTIDALKNWNTPALTHLLFRGCGTISWEVVKPFHKTITRLDIDTLDPYLKRWPVPCERVKVLSLSMLIWNSLPHNLPFLFPHLEELTLYGAGWVVGDRAAYYDNRSTGIADWMIDVLKQDHDRNSKKDGSWTHLEYVRADLPIVYALGLTCSANKLVLRDLSHTTANALLPEVTQSMRIRSLKFGLLLDRLSVPVVTSLLHTFQQCDFAETSRIALLISSASTCGSSEMQAFGGSWPRTVMLMHSIIMIVQRNHPIQDGRSWAFTWRHYQGSGQDCYKFVCRRVRDRDDFRELEPRTEGRHIFMMMAS
ncbi:hypothetical protein K474DRAFT_1707417 [Panus rudis PR-1116 ss-1]|nr:hypothetical protein K474DRAFT_1707417 [Panus rudis PR-1116 ss-1]